MAPSISVLVISMHDESLYAERVLRAGGRGYIMKQEGGKKILEAIRQVAGGRIFLSEKCRRKCLRLFPAIGGGERFESGGPDGPRV